MLGRGFHNEQCTDGLCELCMFSIGCEISGASGLVFAESTVLLFSSLSVETGRQLTRIIIQLGCALYDKSVNHVGE